MYHLLQQFVVLAETHNYRRASEKLFISQPALSKNIKTLEAEFGGKLVNRSNRGCSLTPYGLTLYKHAKAVENEMQFLRSEMTRARLHQENHLIIGMGALWQLLYSTEILLALKRKTQHDPLNITTINDSVEAIIKLLLRGECDFSLGKIPEKLDEKLMGVTITTTYHSIFMRRDHELGLADSILSIEDICKYKWLIFGAKNRIDSYELPQQFKQKVKLQIQHDTGNVFMALNLIQRSDNLTILPHHVGEMMARYDIVELTNHEISFPRFKSGMIFLKDKANNPLIKLMIETLNEIFNKDFLNKNQQSQE